MITVFTILCIGISTTIGIITGAGISVVIHLCISIGIHIVLSHRLGIRIYISICISNIYRLALYLAACRCSRKSRLVLRVASQEMAAGQRFHRISSIAAAIFDFCLLRLGKWLA